MVGWKLNHVSKTGTQDQLHSQIHQAEPGICTYKAPFTNIDRF